MPVRASFTGEEGVPEKRTSPGLRGYGNRRRGGVRVGRLVGRRSSQLSRVGSALAVQSTM
jgi:hypothetical protein